MDSVSQTNSWKKDTNRIVRYCIVLLLLHVFFQFFSNEMMHQADKYSNFKVLFSSRIFRFFYRELIVYTFGFLGYRFIFKAISALWAKVFIYVLFGLDFILCSIGIIHYLIPKNVFYDYTYNYVMNFVASPFYFMVFIIFVVYLKPAGNDK